MDAIELSTIIKNLIVNNIDDGMMDGYESKIKDVRTYDCEGVLSYDDGLVVRTCDGSRFQLTIVKYR